MSKITLVGNIGDWVSLSAEYLHPLVSTYVEYQLFDSTKTYDKSSTIFITNCNSTNQTWYLPYYEQGYKLAIDSLWEKPPLLNELSKLDAYIISNKNWFWYNESLWYKFLNYHTYIPNRTYKKTALMLMRKKTSTRTLLIKKLDTLLNNFLYSYVGAGILLSNDSIKQSGDVDQRYFNPEWYNQTCFSLVSETYTTDTDFITEKTFKPIAFQHPFMVCGQAGTLANLQDLGFETYNNLFDESYDIILPLDLKIDKLISNIVSYKNEPYSKLTLEKIAHNHALFFNDNLIADRFKKEIINPIIEYAET